MHNKFACCIFRFYNPAGILPGVAVGRLVGSTVGGLGALAAYNKRPFADIPAMLLFVASLPGRSFARSAHPFANPIAFVLRSDINRAFARSN